MYQHTVVVDSSVSPASISYSEVFNVAVPFIDRHLTRFGVARRPLSSPTLARRSGTASWRSVSTAAEPAEIAGG